VTRLLKEREVDQSLYEALNFAMRDDEDLLAQLERMVEQDATDSIAAAEADRLAAEAEEQARQRVIDAEHDLAECREAQRVAHENRIATKRVNAAFKRREPIEARLVKTLRAHLSRNRAGVVEWAAFKEFDKEMLPELQLMAQGGLRRLVDAHKRADAHDDVQTLSRSEAEAI